jgi:hypothetical protein
MGVNVDAATRVVDELRAAGVVEERDEALLAGLLSLAWAVDREPGSSALWREYRGFIEAVRGVGVGGVDDDTAEFLVSVRTPLVDAADARPRDVRASGRRRREAVGVAVDAVAGTGGVGRRRARS